MAFKRGSTKQHIIWVPTIFHIMISDVESEDKFKQTK